VDWHAPASSQPILRHTTRKRRRSATLGRHAAARSVGRRRALLAWIRRIVGSQDVELVPLAVNVRRRARSGTCGSGRVGLASVTGQDQPGLALCTAWSRSRRRVSIPALMSVIVGGAGASPQVGREGPGTTTAHLGQPQARGSPAQQTRRAERVVAPAPWVPCCCADSQVVLRPAAGRVCATYSIEFVPLVQKTIVATSAGRLQQVAVAAPAVWLEQSGERERGLPSDVVLETEGPLEVPVLERPGLREQQ
jgi:hypothetical protein